MEKNRSYGFAFTVSIFLILGLVAVSSCVAAEFKRTKEKDLKLDGKSCYLPESPAFGLGITALICLSIVQILGTYMTVKEICSSTDKNAAAAADADGDIVDKRNLAISLLIFSWGIYGFAVAILSVTSNMNQRQNYGTGWLDGECYIVKGGVYIGAAFVVLITVVSLLGSVCFTKMKYWRKQVDSGRKVYAQVVL